MCTRCNRCTVHYIVPYGVQLQHRFSYSFDYYSACATCSKRIWISANGDCKIVVWLWKEDQSTKNSVFKLKAWSVYSISSIILDKVLMFKQLRKLQKENLEGKFKELHWNPGMCLFNRQESVYISIFSCCFWAPQMFVWCPPSTAPFPNTETQIQSRLHRYLMGRWAYLYPLNLLALSVYSNHLWGNTKHILPAPVYSDLSWGYATISRCVPEANTN